MSPFLKSAIRDWMHAGDSLVVVVVFGSSSPYYRSSGCLLHAACLGRLIEKAKEWEVNLSHGVSSVSFFLPLRTFLSQS